MSYESVDQLQKALAVSVFHYASDKKKVAGRALGTLVEIVTFYTLKAWGLRDFIAIERPLTEFRNSEIAHNVEYSLHPRLATFSYAIRNVRPPISASNLRRLLQSEGALRLKTPSAVRNNQLLSRQLVLRNSCTIAETEFGPLIAHLDRIGETSANVTINELHNVPFAIFECKRVGIEEGNRKGPQTIEKAKQGAYVARTVSSLQRLRLRDGAMGGVIHRRDGTLYCKLYNDLLKEVIESEDADLLDGFVLTVGVVSNHGNWFTSENKNKELKVLAQSYDWLLFLTDQGLSEFIDELLLNPTDELKPARTAFEQSYTGAKGKNRFTKVKMDLEADRALQSFFRDNAKRVAKWFNVIAPGGARLTVLKNELKQLGHKDWKRIRKL